MFWVGVYLPGPQMYNFPCQTIRMWTAQAIGLFLGGIVHFGGTVASHHLLDIEMSLLVAENQCVKLVAQVSGPPRSIDSERGAKDDLSKRNNIVIIIGAPIVRIVSVRSQIWFWGRSVG